MDNNFNQGQPIQGQPQQPVQPQQPIQQAQYNPQGQPVQQAQYNPQGQPVQPQYNVPGQDPFANQYAAPKKPLPINLFELISYICAGVGMLMVFFGTLFTCICSAKFETVAKAGKLTMSPIFILTIFGIIIAGAGVALAIVAIKDTKSPVKATKFAKLAAVVGVFAIIYGILPTVTICGYNCNLNNMEADYDYNDLYQYNNFFN